MVNDNAVVGPKITISFTKASTKDGPEGFHIHVEEGADEAEANRLMALAQQLRVRAATALGGDASSVVPVLTAREQSFAAQVIAGYSEAANPVYPLKISK